MKRGNVGAGMLLPLLVTLTACGDDSTTPQTFTTDQLTTELAISPDHLHAFQTLVTFTVSVTDPNGDPVTDFNVVQVERKLSGAAAFSVMETALNGSFYEVQHTFEASGDYDIRVTGLRPSDSELVVLHEEATQAHVVRPHADIGGYHLQLEPSPGHIHEGDTSDLQFWIVDEVTEAAITGLTPTIFINESVVGLTEYAAVEGADGLYHAEHAFTDAGATEIGIRFIGADTNEYEWPFDIEVHEAHGG